MMSVSLGAAGPISLWIIFYSFPYSVTLLHKLSYYSKFICYYIVFEVCPSLEINSLVVKATGFSEKYFAPFKLS